MENRSGTQESLGLNQEKGHSEANRIISDISSILNQYVQQGGAHVTPYRDGGKLIFIAEAPSKKGLATLKSAFQDAQVVVAKARIKNADENSQSPASPNNIADSKRIELNISYTSLNETIQERAPVKSNPKPAQNHQGDTSPWTESRRRHDNFINLATSKGHVTGEDAESLYESAGGTAKDPLTGFDRASDRIPTLQNVMGEVTNRGTSAYYVEADIRNLGGLNRQFGRAGADEIYSKITETVDKHLKALNVEMASFRHGGDEFSFIVVSKDPNGTNELGQEALIKALDSAQEELKQIFEEEFKEKFPGLQQLEHAKYPNDPSKRGTGVTFGTSGIKANDSVEHILQTADRELEANKLRKPLT